MAEKIDFENGRNSNFEGLVTLTLTFDPAIRHIVLQQSSTSTYVPTFIQIEETFCGRTDVRTYGRTDVQTDVRTGRRTFFPSILLGRLSEVDLKSGKYEAEVTEDCARHVVLLKLTTDRHEALFGLSVTAQLRYNFRLCYRILF